MKRDEVWKRDPVRRRDGVRRRGAPLVPAVLLALALAAPVQAHGPTMRAGQSGVRPVSLVVNAGDTVHFKNANASGAPVTLVFEQAPEGAGPEGAALERSPVMARAGDWHYRFDVVGEYVFKVEGTAGRRGTIHVVAKP